MLAWEHGTACIFRSWTNGDRGRMKMVKWVVWEVTFKREENEAMWHEGPRAISVAENARASETLLLQEVGFKPVRGANKNCRHVTGGPERWRCHLHHLAFEWIVWIDINLPVQRFEEIAMLGVFDPQDDQQHQVGYTMPLWLILAEPDMQHKGCIVAQTWIVQMLIITTRCAYWHVNYPNSGLKLGTETAIEI